VRTWDNGCLDLFTITFLRCLHIALGANTSIVSQFYTVKTTTWVNWGIIPYWCTWAILTRIWSTWCHWVEFFGLLKRTLKLLILSMVSALSTRMNLRVLWRVVTRTIVTARLSLRLKLALLLAKFIAFIFQAYCLIQQHLEVRKCVALQMIVKWPYQTIQKVFLSFCIRVDFI
jgi:hypothetical protein